MRGEQRVLVLTTGCTSWLFASSQDTRRIQPVKSPAAPRCWALQRPPVGQAIIIISVSLHHFQMCILILSLKLLEQSWYMRPSKRFRLKINLGIVEIPNICCINVSVGWKNVWHATPSCRQTQATKLHSHCFCSIYSGENGCSLRRTEAVWDLAILDALIVHFGLAEKCVKTYAKEHAEARQHKFAPLCPFAFSFAALDWLQISSVSK